MARPPEVRHFAAPLLGLLGCFRFWECRSLGGRETLAAKDAKKRKESALHEPNGVQWFHDDNCKMAAAHRKRSHEMVVVADSHGVFHCSVFGANIYHAATKVFR
jgi:hypothetical protein